MRTLAHIEMPKGTKYKYELKDGILVIDRVLNQECPANYGYIPDTMCADGDALDVFIISSNPIVPLTEVSFTVVGMLQCEDDGKVDDKVIGVLEGEEHLHNIDEAKWAIRNYLTTYKPGFKVEEWLDVKDTIVSLTNYFVEEP